MSTAQVDEKQEVTVGREMERGQDEMVGLYIP